MSAPRYKQTTDLEAQNLLRLYGEFQKERREVYSRITDHIENAVKPAFQTVIGLFDNKIGTLKSAYIANSSSLSVSHDNFGVLVYEIGYTTKDHEILPRYRVITRDDPERRSSLYMHQGDADPAPVVANIIRASPEFLSAMIVGELKQWYMNKHKQWREQP